MKTHISLIVLFLLMAGAVETTAQVAADFKKLDWLQGTWTRTNVKPGRSGYERWEKKGNEWIGFGVSLKGADTAFVEKIKMIAKDDAIWYVPDVPENGKPVYFKVTQITDKGFACENPKHDFPKRIEYWVDGNKLKATISGDGKSMDYLFEKAVR